MISTRQVVFNDWEIDSAAKKEARLNGRKASTPRRAGHPAQGRHRPGNKDEVVPTLSPI